MSTHLLTSNLSTHSAQPLVGLSRREEVWDGVTVLMPEPNIEHQDIAGFFATVFTMLFVLGKSAHVNSAPNLSNRITGWEKNYRNPDMGYFSSTTTATNCGTHWCGGPDFLLEIVSPNDRSREKLDFYAQIGTREVLLIDRDPWKLEHYILQEGALKKVWTATPDEGVVISEIVPLTFSLEKGSSRPLVRITHLESKQSWSL